MAADFTAEDWAKMTNLERIERCEEYAREAEVIGASAHPDRKAQFMKIAERWRAVANDIEQTSKW